MRIINYTEEITRCPYVFVYGTLKKGYYNNYILKDSIFIDVGFTTSKFKLFNVGFPFAIPNKKGNFIKGEIYRIIDIKTFKKLDRLEGYPTFYNRKIVNIITHTNKLYNCWMYIYDKEEGQEITEVKYDNILNIKYKEWR